MLTGAVRGKAQATLGILIEFSCVIAIPLIAITLYPALRRVSAVLAIGHVAFRLFEAALVANQEIDRLFVLALSGAYVATPQADAAVLELFASTLVGGEAWSGVSGPIYNLVVVTGMLMLNWILWISRLVPRWISAWGFVTVLFLGGVAIWGLFLDIDTTIAITLIAPLAVQEIVLALWFIFKGFDQAALAALPASA